MEVGLKDLDVTSHASFLSFINRKLFAQLQINEFHGISPIGRWLAVGGRNFWLTDFAVSMLTDRLVFMVCDIVVPKC